MTGFVEILLATYKPNMEFLKIQLESLNRQDYPSLFMSIRDDSADEKSFTQIEAMLRSTVTRFPYILKRNETNIGSNRTFMKLTEEATGFWLAYCDQDDDWSSVKISRLITLAEKDNAVLAYSNLAIIDQNGVQIHASFKAINPRLKHVFGDDKFDFFLRRNSVTGCTMLILGSVAHQALPFEVDHYVHDHWLALYASSKGRIAYSSEPLISYRIHSNNQIGNSILKGISNVHDYVDIRLMKEINVYRALLDKNRFFGQEKILIENKLRWVEKRYKFLRAKNISTFKVVLSSFPKDPQLVLFEIFLAFAPEKISEAMLTRMQK